MKELYWITVLGNASTVTSIIAVIAIIIAIIVPSMAYIFEEDKYERRKARIVLRHYTTIAAITGLIAIFIPSKEELLFIYGVGSTVDYIQSNEEAKQLPDKAVKALNLWADDYLENNKTNETTD